MDKMDIDLPVTTKPLETMNNIYRFQFMHLDLHNIYEEILDEVPIDLVDKAFSEYIVDNIEPVGWNAIFMPKPNDYYYIVEVLDVHDDLKAYVTIQEKVLKTNDNNLSDENDSIDYAINVDYRVPLDELYVISDNDSEKMFEKTALNIEILRFFYQNLIQPWDELNESRDAFFTTCIVPRLKLIFDFKQKLISEKLMNRYEEILAKANEIKKELDKVNKDITINVLIHSNDLDQMDDSVNQLNAIDYLRLKLKLEELQHEMKFIENPGLRTFYDVLASVREDETDPTVHLVAEKHFNFSSLSNAMTKLNSFLNNEASWPIKLHNSFTKALKSAKSGDKVFLTSGTYCHSSSWIQDDIEICGIDSDVTIISSKDCGDMFMFFNVPTSVKISNLTIKAGHRMENLLLIKSGHLILDGCILDCNNMVNGDPIKPVNDSTVTQLNTKIINHNVIFLCP